MAALASRGVVRICCWCWHRPCSQLCPPFVCVEVLITLFCDLRHSLNCIQEATVNQLVLHSYKNKGGRSAQCRRDEEPYSVDMHTCSTMSRSLRDVFCAWRFWCFRHRHVSKRAVNEVTVLLDGLAVCVLLHHLHMTGHFSV